MSTPAPQATRWSLGTSQTAAFIISAVLMFCLAVTVVFSAPRLLIVAAPIAMAFGLVVVRYPTAALCIGICIKPLVDMTWNLRIAPVSNMQLYAGGMTVFFAFIALILRRRLIDHPHFWPAVVWLSLTAIAAARSSEPLEAIELVARLTGPILLLLIAYPLMATRTWQKRWMLGLTVSGGICQLVSWYYFLFTNQMAEKINAGYQRLYGGFAEVHAHAHMMALFCIVGVFWYFQTSTLRGRLLSIAYILSALFLLYETLVRTPMVGLASFMVLSLALRRRFDLLAVAAAVVLMVSIVDPDLQERFGDIYKALFATDLDQREFDKLGSGRTAIWGKLFADYVELSSWDMTFGAGLGAQRDLGAEGTDSHSDYLGLLAQLGPLGLGSYLLMQFIALLRAQRTSIDDSKWATNYSYLMIGLTAHVFAVNSLSNSYINRITLAWIYMMFCGIAVQASRNSPEKDGA